MQTTVPTTERGQIGANSESTAIQESIAWKPGANPPADPGFFAAKSSFNQNSEARRVLFTGTFWMTDAPVLAWRPLTAQEAILNEENSFAFLVDQKDRDSAKLLKDAELAPWDRPLGVELQALKKITELELKMTVEVTKFVAPTEGAEGVTRGVILAASTNFVAQQGDGGRVILHKTEALSAPVSLGEEATISYFNGRGLVCNGKAHDISISAPWMSGEQRGYIRMVMFDALSQMTAPQSEDAKLKDAMKFALESAANFFGLKASKLRGADIDLVVNERTTHIKSENTSEAGSAIKKTMRPS